MQFMVRGLVVVSLLGSASSFAGPYYVCSYEARQQTPYPTGGRGKTLERGGIALRQDSRTGSPYGRVRASAEKWNENGGSLGKLKTEFSTYTITGITEYHASRQPFLVTYHLTGDRQDLRWENGYDSNGRRSPIPLCDGFGDGRLFECSLDAFPYLMFDSRLLGWDITINTLNPKEAWARARNSYDPLKPVEFWLSCDRRDE